MKRLQFLQGAFIELFVVLDAKLNNLAHHVMGFAKRCAFSDQVIGESVARVKPSDAMLSMRSRWKVTAGKSLEMRRRVLMTVSAVSKTGSLSSWRSRLYARGRALTRVRRASGSRRCERSFPASVPERPDSSFWGMMLDPVQNASLIPMNANSVVDHRISSSAILLTCIMRMADAEQNSIR